ncbi:MAG TPA: Kdo hydroxylase family protein [Bryobacteraceae bacterium]|nr:Kdo hydroxylase family protein [Bryobacteraceae bacterium]
MSEILEKTDIQSWEGPFAPAVSAKTIEALETGQIFFAPLLTFDLSEQERRFLTPDCLDGKSKNVSFRPATGALQGTRLTGADRSDLLGMLQRYYQRSTALVKALCPQYGDRLSPGFTSFRPAEIKGRGSSWRKDDTRLHVDAFPSRPLGGLRILRVFTNVNPAAPRQWRVGEPFEQVAKTFLPRIRPPFPGSSWLLYRMRIVKGMRTPYDHLMLGIHDCMKADQSYQSKCSQSKWAIPAGATWACFTDAVSHAAMAGQFAFEQTFYLPVEAMQDASRSPLRVLERMTGRGLA